MYNDYMITKHSMYCNQQHHQTQHTAAWLTQFPVSWLQTVKAIYIYSLPGPFQVAENVRQLDLLYATKPDNILAEMLHATASVFQNCHTCIHVLYCLPY